MAILPADTDPNFAAAHARDLRHAVDIQQLRAAVYRCHQSALRLLLPDQQHAALQSAERILARIHARGDDAGALPCDSDERAFVRYWCGPPSDRLNGTQQLALTCYRDGRYAGARQVSEVMALDNGMAWSLVGHLKATPDPDHAHRQIRRTFERAMCMAESARDALNAQISAPVAVPDDRGSCDPGHTEPSP